MELIEKLAQYFEKFPGIGRRQSKRFVYFLLNSNSNYLKGLVDSISALKENINQCQDCYLYHNSQELICEICSSEKTDKSILMIVEKDIDYENIKKSNTFSGQYFILGGLVFINSKNITEKVRIKELLKRINQKIKNDNLQEIIIALSLTSQGDQTDAFLRKNLKTLQEKYNFKVSSLGRGLSTGTELEYSDNETLQNALKNRS